MLCTKQVEPDRYWILILILGSKIILISIYQPALFIYSEYIERIIPECIYKHTFFYNDPSNVVIEHICSGYFTV